MSDKSKNWRNLLNRWISGEADRTDERSLEALAKDDPFFADALEGYRSVPEADHARSVTRLKANLRKRNEKKGSGAVFYMMRIAAVAVVVLGAWLVFRAFDTSENKAMTFDERSEGSREMKSNAKTAPAPIAQDSTDSEDQYIVNYSDAEIESNGITADFNATDVAAELLDDAPQAVKILPPAITDKHFEKSNQQAVVRANEGTSDKPGQEVEEAKARIEEAKKRLAESSNKKVEEEAKKKMAEPRKDEVALANEAKQPDPFYDENEAREQAAPKPAAPPMVTEDAGAEYDAVENMADGFIATTLQTIKGKVTDDNGDPLIGASIVIGNTQQGTVTGLDGNFAIDSPVENPSLTIAYTGFESQEIQVGGNEFLNIQLTQGMALDEVVVTGLTQKSKTALPVLAPKGGFKKFEKYIKENLRMPQAAIDEGIKGEVILDFTIDSSGKPTDIKTLQPLGSGCTEEAFRLLENGPKWNGQPGVRHSYTFEFK